jgi:hypothetical protein
MSNDINNKTSKYLAWMVFIITVLGLLYVYTQISSGFSNETTWIDLLKEIIPGFLGPLFSFFIIYLLFLRLGINIEDVLKKGGTETEWLKRGYETFDEIDWHPYLAKCNKLVIVAFFFEEWVSDNDKSFTKFINKKDTRLVIYLPDYRNEQLLKKIHELIPEYSAEQLATKIKLSITEVKKRVKNKTTQDISVSLYGNVFNYTIQLFDKEMFLSVNQLCRDKDFKSPFILFDLNNSSQVESFYSGETKTLEQRSSKIDLNGWV